MDLYGISLLFPVIISFVFIVQLTRKIVSNNDISVKVLLSIIILFFIICIAILIRETRSTFMYWFLDSILRSLNLAIHPLFFLYVRSMTLSKLKWKTFVFHLLPAFTILFLSCLCYLQLDRDEVIAYLNRNMWGEPSGSLVINCLYGIYLTSKYVHALQAVIYFTWVLLLIRNHRIRINDLFSTTENYKLNWLFTFYLVYSFISLVGLLFNLIPPGVVQTSNIYIQVTMICLGLFVLYIGTKGMEQRSVGQIIAFNDMNTTIKNGDSDLSINSLVDKIDNYILKEKAFLNPELKIWDIVRNTGINRSYISQIINTEYKLNFNHYINKLRVEKACRMLKADKSTTIDSIAFECGFNSMSTFNRAFKMFMGIPPSEYRVKNYS